MICFKPRFKSLWVFLALKKKIHPHVLLASPRIAERNGQCDLNSHLLNSHSSGSRSTDLHQAQGVANPHPVCRCCAPTDGRMCRWISSQTVTVIDNNFLLCQGIYMQINVSNVHLLIPTINHYRLAHQFLDIIRSYRQGCNIILNTVSLPSICSWCSRKLHINALTIHDTASVVVWGGEWGEISE